MDTATVGECYACDVPIDGTGTDEMGMCDNCLHLWWQHADDPHDCSWGCVADFHNYQPREGN